jgi:hypothetical protein
LVAAAPLAAEDRQAWGDPDLVVRSLRELLALWEA